MLALRASLGTNYRFHANKAMEATKEHVPWFGLEQEYSLLDADGWPLAWPKGGYPGPQGPCACSSLFCRPPDRDSH